MNDIKFKRIVLDSFLSYDHEEVEINEAGIVYIKGENNQDSKSDSNGSGKSALISESLLWCLTGYTSRNASEVSNMFTGRGAYVTVELDKDESSYVITRGTHESVVGNGITIIKDGENMTKHRISDTKEYLETELPELSWSVLTSIVILTQGLVGGLSNMSNKDRKVKLEELSKVDVVYDTVKSLIDNVETRYKLKTADIEKSKYELKIKSDANSEMIKSLNESIKAIEVKNADRIDDEMINQQLKTFEDLARSRSDEYERLSLKVKEYEDSLHQLRLKQSKEVEINTNLEKSKILIKSELSSIESDLNSVSTLIDARSIYLNSIQDEECPTCKQAVKKDITENLKASLNLEISEMMNSLPTYEAIKIKKSSELVEVESKLIEQGLVLNSIISDLRLVQVELTEVKTKLDQIIKEREEYNSNVKYLMTLKSLKQESTDSYKSKVVELSESNKIIDTNLTEVLRDESKVSNKLSVAKWFSTQSSKALRSFMLEGVVDFLNGRCKEYSEYLFDEDVVRLLIDGTNLDIYLGNKLVENTSGGEHRRLDIVLQLAIRDLVINEAGFSSNLLVIDEVFDHLDSLGMTTVLDLIISQRSTIGSIFLITHKSDADLDYDDILVVRKGRDNISRLVK